MPFVPPTRPYNAYEDIADLWRWLGNKAKQSKRYLTTPLVRNSDEEKKRLDSLHWRKKD